jgi:hypothetical protein
MRVSGILPSRWVRRYRGPVMGDCQVAGAYSQ